MHVKKNRGKVYGASFSYNEQKAIEMEIKNQLADYDKNHAKELSAMVLWVLHTEFGFGEKRLKKFYDIYADNLTIKSSSISDLAGYNRFHVAARNKLSLIDVDGIGDYYFKIKNVYFSSDKEILFKNTNIDCLSISIDTEKIVSVNSNLRARKNANIESYEISDLVLDSPNIICNDINVSSGKMCLNKGNTLLDRKKKI